MLIVQKSPESVAAHLGGTECPAQELPDVVYQWLEDASAGVEALIKNANFEAIFQKFSQVDSMTPAQVLNYANLVNAGVKQLRGVVVSVAPLGREYARHICPAADQNMKIYINSHLLLTMCAVMDSLTSNIARTELVMQFTSFLAGKIFHQMNHLLLTLVNNLDPSLNLIDVSKDGSVCPPKKYFGKTFTNIGNLMERVCFGGILLLECWEQRNGGTMVLLASDESLKRPKAVPTIASVGKGELVYVNPAAEPVTGQKRAHGTSHLVTTDTSPLQDEGGGEEGSDSEKEEDSEGEQPAVRFLPVAQWATARRYRRATARP